MADTSSGPFDFWEKFSDGDDFSYYDEECKVPDNLVEDVLDIFGLEHTFIPGTSLPNLDIKQMDAYQVIKLSLMHAGAQEYKFYELTVNEYGEISFYELADAAISNEINKYYEFQTHTFTELCTGVMITGAKPLVTRKKAEFKEIWYNSYKAVFHTPWMSGNCMKDNFSQFATIVFNDPHLEFDWEDGIDNFIERAAPWENLIGYARYIDWPGSDAAEASDTTVVRTTQARIPVNVSSSAGDTYKANLGKKLFVRPALKAFQAEDPECFASVSGPIAPFEDGVLIPIPKEFRYETIRGTIKDKIIDIDAICIIGREIDSMRGIPSSNSDAVTGGTKTPKIEVSITSSQDTTIKLTPGKHYQIAFKKTSGSYVPPEPYVVFANNCRQYDPAIFGNDVLFNIDQSCPFYKEVGTATYQGTLLPTGGVKGFLVKQVFAIVSLDTPSIIVQDPRIEEGNSTAFEIANNLSYQLAPLISVDAPAPIAFAGPGATNGEILDQAGSVKDSDPTTVQDFSQSDVERRVAQMAEGGAGLSLNFSFIDDENDLKKLAAVLYEQMNQGVGVVSTYICGPESTPRLGMKGEDDGTVVNSISYSYTDSNSYTISVSTGPRQLGNLAQISSQPAYRMPEDISSKATVIEDQGNHIHYKVIVEGMQTPMLAINCAPSVIRVGDRVTVSMHNNPAES